ncbi:hypothetical protein JTE90_024883 [Oedothorax gibbosus]|uniref:Uncharacterized protein n=1 Tax=Oedothorax gibbosus TaxID=931172 RepID=A0AAV6V542_9ARAC|nr:hypothetical protein JTE90_024883 [Oedothorax gibbosus]
MFEIGNLLDKLLFGTKIHYNNVVYYPVLYSLITLNFFILIGGLVAYIRCRHRKEKPTRKKRVKRKTTVNRTKRKQSPKYSSSSSTTSESDSSRSFKIKVVPKTRPDYASQSVQTKTSARYKNGGNNSVKSMRTKRNYNDTITQRHDYKTQANCSPRVFVPQFTVSTQTETIRPSVIKKTSSTQTNSMNLEQNQLTFMETSLNIPNFPCNKHYSNYPEPAQKMYSHRHQNFQRDHPAIRDKYSPDKYECDYYRTNDHNMVTHPEENHNFYEHPERKTFFGVHLKPVHSPQINLFR